jgi:fermentation-respiration switch protein FrsA (DUF1100 family)
MRAVRAAPDSQAAVASVRSLVPTERLRAFGVTDAQRDAIAAQYASPWMHYFLRYDPPAYLSRLRIPVLALGGSLDQQVPSAENLPAIRAALAGNADATVRELPSLNHMFQTAETGAMGEYDRIAETFAPSAMELIADWIVARVGTTGATPARR